MMDQKMKDIMIHIQLNNLCSLTNGKWHKSSTLDYTGKQTTKYTIEFDTPEESDSSESDVTGSDNSDT